jgi:hypothetical protein
MSNETNEPKRPSHYVYAVNGEREKGFWTKIGAAFPNKDGQGFNLVLNAVPLVGRMVMREITEQDDASNRSGGAQ